MSRVIGDWFHFHSWRARQKAISFAFAALLFLFLVGARRGRALVSLHTSYLHQCTVALQQQIVNSFSCTPLVVSGGTMMGVFVVVIEVMVGAKLLFIQACRPAAGYVYWYRHQNCREYKVCALWVERGKEQKNLGS
jgi:hypothetical protein